MRDVVNKCVTDMPNRVPEVTLAFWVIKIMSTTVGETGADYLAVHVGLGTTLTGAIMICLLAEICSRDEAGASQPILYASLN